MLANPVHRLPEGNGWQYEIKLDGYRTVAAKLSGKPVLFSRRGNRVNNKFSPIASALEPPPDGTVLDGETAVLDNISSNSWPSLGRCLKELTICATFCLSCDANANMPSGSSSDLSRAKQANGYFSGNGTAIDANCGYASIKGAGALTFRPLSRLRSSSALTAACPRL